MTNKSRKYKADHLEYWGRKLISQINFRMSILRESIGGMIILYQCQAREQFKCPTTTPILFFCCAFVSGYTFFPSAFIPSAFFLTTILHALAQMPSCRAFSSARSIRVYFACRTRGKEKRKKKGIAFSDPHLYFSANLVINHRARVHYAYHIYLCYTRGEEEHAYNN